MIMRRTFNTLMVTLGTAMMAVAQYTFTDISTLPCTPIENQQQTNTCWSFATTSFLESEILRTGGTAVDLSEMYVVRTIYLDKARNYLLRQGKANFAQGGLSHDVIHATASSGAMPEEAYPGKVSQEGVFNHDELSVVLKAALDAMLKSRTVSPTWPETINALLDVHIGALPKSFEKDDQVFTPEEYATVLGLDLTRYVNLTSFTHHPFYTSFVLEIPDNHANGSYYNLPLEDLVSTTFLAVNKGYTVAWDGDVSEKGFSAEHGLAVLPSDQRDDVFSRPGAEQMITQELRQLAFEQYATTDDHLMQIIGTARDQRGTRYLVIKNSWGVIGPYSGYVYMSEAYLRAKTIAIMVHRDAIPAEIANKIEW
jgi:bleomycin hydrolase